MPPLFPAGFVVEASAGSYEVAEALSHRWNITTTQLEKGRYDFRVRAVHSPQIQIGRVFRSLGTRLDGKVPEGTVTMAVALNRDARIQFRGRRLEALDLIVQEDREGLDFSFMGGIEILTLAVSHAELDRRAMAQWGKPFPRSSRFGVHRFVGHGERQRACHQLAAGLDEALQAAGKLTTVEASSRFENSILETLFLSLEDQSKAQGRTDRHRAAKKAVDFLHARSREEVSMTEICEAIGANRRTLHLAFMELYGITPMKYLRALKLCGARGEITKAREQGRHVTDVAMAWGFNHLGRFSAYYREFFGELPSVGRAGFPTGLPPDARDPSR